MADTSFAILIVDDDEGDRRHIKRALQQSGILEVCTESSSLEEALRSCEHTAFDCVLLDYLIPDAKGLGG